MEKRIIIAGSGGQGILFLGRVIAHSAVLEGLEVTWFPSYGAEMRGGTANCMVVISDELIGSPIIRNADFLIALNQASLKKYLNRVQKDGSILYDSSLITERVESKEINVYAVEAAKEAAKIFSPKFANMVLLGVFVKVSGLIKIESVLKAIDEILRSKGEKTVETNRSLILRGYSLVENQKS